jgi:hypothetical protein
MPPEETSGPEDAVTPSIFSSDLRAIETTIKLMEPYLEQNHLTDAQAARIGRTLWANLRNEEAKRRAKVFTVGDSVRYSQFGEWRSGIVVNLQVGGIIVEVRDSESNITVWRNINFHEIIHA